MEAYAYGAIRQHTGDDGEFLDLESVAGSADLVKDKLAHWERRLGDWSQAHPVRAIVRLYVATLSEGQTVAQTTSRRGKAKEGKRRKVANE